jgi:hypothetical protein
MLEGMVEEEDRGLERQRGRASNTSAGNEENWGAGRRKTVHSVQEIAQWSIWIPFL